MEGPTAALDDELGGNDDPNVLATVAVLELLAIVIGEDMMMDNYR